MFQKIKFFLLSIKSLLIGMRVTIKNYFAKSVTLNYPVVKQPMKKNFRGMVDLIPPDCVICYQCIKICPVAALDLGHKNVVVAEKKEKEITKFTFNGELCCYCGLCEEICPTDAIFLNQMYEVSTYTHDDVKKIDLMKADKYNHIDPNYHLDGNPKKETKPAPVKAAAPAPQAAPAPSITPPVPPPEKAEPPK